MLPRHYSDFLVLVNLTLRDWEPKRSRTAGRIDKNRSLPLAPASCELLREKIKCPITTAVT